MMKFKEFFEETYLTERKGVAIQIINDLIDNINEDETQQSFKNKSYKYLTSVGGDFLGEGVFAEVYGGKSGGYVVKIAYDDPVYSKFIDSIKDINNPLFPKVIESKTITVGNTYSKSKIDVDLYVLERLSIDLFTNREFNRKINNIVGKPLNDFIHIIGENPSKILPSEVGPIESILKEVGRSFDQLLEFSSIIYKLGDGYENDINFRNYGFDSNGGLVIFDPLSDS